MKKAKPIYLDSTIITKVIVYGAILGAIYFSAFQRLIFNDWAKDDYSHCILVPFIVAYLLWEKQLQFKKYISKPSLNGIYFFIVGLLLYWLGELAGEFFSIYMSFWIIICSLCLLNMGWIKTKVIFFPLLFSLTMFPFPNFINNRITLQLKLLSTKIGVLMMQLYGMSAFREGNVIDLGFTKLQIVDACSGLRYLFPMIVLSILLAYYYRAKWWKRFVVVMSSIPLTILSNSLRIALTGILSEKIGSAAVEGFFHDFEGLIIFLLTLVVLLSEIWILKRIFPEKIREGTAEKLDEETEFNSSFGWNFFKTPHFFIPIVLLLVSLGISYGVEFREEIPMRKSFKNFPMKVANWQGVQQTIEEKLVNVLDFTDYIMADYSDKSGKNVNFYVAYYATQRKGASIHSPATCLRGGGWHFKKSGEKDMDLKHDFTISVNRAVIEKNPYQQISYYWFPARDRILTNALQMKWYNFLDALTRQRTDGSLVRVIAQVYPNETVEDAEKRLQAFVSDIYPVLNQYLPE